MKILIVDDETSVVRVLMKFFRQAGHETMGAPSGEEALAAFERNPDIDLVISDLRMPGIDGIEVARRVKNIRPETRVWLMTGAPDDEKTRAACQIGIEQFFNKDPDSIQRMRTFLQPGH